MRKTGYKNTFKFYQNKFRWKVEKFNHPFFLPNYFAPMIGDKKEIHIADLGAGMIATTGNLWNDVKVHIHPSDFLADEFSLIWKERGVSPLISVEKQDMEKLTYDDNTFDIIHCVNALDHTKNPKVALLEMIRVCKPGGWIYLRHISNEAEKQSYQGLHQWNIKKDGNDCLIWNKNTAFTISSINDKFITELRNNDSTPFYVSEECVVSIFQKTCKI